MTKAVDRALKELSWVATVKTQGVGVAQRPSQTIPPRQASCTSSRMSVAPIKVVGISRTRDADRVSPGRAYVTRVTSPSITSTITRLDTRGTVSLQVCLQVVTHSLGEMPITVQTAAQNS